MFDDLFKGITWGLDGVDEAVLESPLPKPISDMNLGEVRDELAVFDKASSYLYEELEWGEMSTIWSRVPNHRADKYERAQALAQVVNATGGRYAQLVQRFAEVAKDPLDVRSAVLRASKIHYEALTTHPRFIALRDRVGGIRAAATVSFGPHNEISLGTLEATMQSEPDADVRRGLYDASRGLSTVSSAIKDAISELSGVVSELSSGRYSNPSDLMTHHFEVGEAADVAEMMRQFVRDTKVVYDALFRELVTVDTIESSDVDYHIVSKDPFSSLTIPKDPHALLDLGFALVGDLGYDMDIVRPLFDPKNPRTFIDIEARDGKLPNAGISCLGSHSDGKLLFYYDPVRFASDARKRVGTFPHELGHVLHHVFTRMSLKGERPEFYHDVVPTSETFSMFHDGIVRSVEGLRHYGARLGFKEADAETFAKWNLFMTLHTLYKTSGISIGEIGTHLQGADHADDAFNAASNLIRPPVTGLHFGPSPTIVKVPHLYGMPGYYCSYFMGELNRLAVSQVVMERQGRLISPDTSTFLIDNLMTGNGVPFPKRLEAIGITNPVQSAVAYIKKEYKRLTER